MHSSGESSLFIDNKTRLGLYAFTAITIAATACQITQPYFMGALIDGIIAHNQLLTRFSVLFSFAIASLLLEQISLSFINALANHWKVSTRNRLLAAWCLQEPSEAENWGQGEAGMKFMRDIPILGNALQNCLPQLIQAILMFTFAISVAFWQCWQIGLVILLALPVLLSIHFLFQKRFRFLAHQSRIMQDNLCSRVFEFLHSYPELKALHGECSYQNKVKSHLKEIGAVEYANTTNLIVFHRCFALLLLVCEYTTLAIACHFASNGRLPIGKIVFFQVMIMRVLNSGVGVLQILPHIAEVREAKDSLLSLLNRGESPCQDSSEGTLGEHIESLDLLQVTFAYPNTQRVILNDFSLHINAGEVIALEGINGIGKTTLWKILIGWHSPSKGMVTANGHDVKMYLGDYRRRISFVTQRVLLFYGTLLENITLGEEYPDQIKLSNALQTSGFDKVIERFPDGLERRIENNADLSGGECQRLALARALYRSPEILVLDEVTNHMDKTGKELVKSLIMELRGKATVIIISHEEDVRALCDKEVVLKCQESVEN